MTRGAERFEGGVDDAAMAPLEDLNLRRTEIPEILASARVQPYSLTGMETCPAIAAEIARLDAVLGTDVDMPHEDPAVADQAADGALSAVRDVATDLIPMRSWVRRLSGAHAHAIEVEQAIEAGIARRGFLKGVSRGQDCPQA